MAALCEAAERDPAAAIARGSAGQADVATRYRWSDVADAYEDLARRAAQYAPWPVMTALAVLARMTTSSAIDQVSM